MEICSEGHDEVCYTSRYCPACEYKEKLENLEEELNAEIDKLSNSIQEIKDHE